MSGRWLRRAFRLPASRRRLDAELDAELRFHLEGRVEDLMRREGLTRTAAESEARRRFGDLDAYRRQTRAIDHHTYTRRRGMEMLDDLRRETRSAFRALRRAPSFSLIALATLALGLGATTAIFTLLDRVVLRPLPYANAERLVHLGTSWPGIKPDEEYGISRYMFVRFRETSRTLENVGLYQGNLFSLPAEHGFDAERIVGASATASLFRVLDIRPALGRLITAEEQIVQSPGVVLLGHALWQRRFGGDPGIVGRSIDVGGRLLEVVGVLPPSAKLPDVDVQLWTPLYVDPGEPARNSHTLKAIGLVRAGVTTARAHAELDAITRRIVADNPEAYGPGFLARTGFALALRPLRDEVVGPRTARALWILFGSVGLVLLVAAANVANLFLVRVDARRREVALRTALGASRWQLAAHYLGESLLLTAAAAGCAVALGWGLLQVLLAVAPTTLPRLEEVQLGWRSVAVCAGIAAVAGVVFGLLPLAQPPLDVAMLREGGRGLTSSRGRSATRRALVVGQVALAVVLLAAAGLLLKSFQHLRGVKPGFDAEGVLTMNVTLFGERYRTDAQLIALWDELTRRVATLPGVVGSGATSTLPLDGGGGCSGVTAGGSSLDPSRHSACIPTIFVAPGYFRTLGIPLRGAEADWAANRAGTGTMVVSRALANRFWPGESPIGRTLTFSVRRPLTYRITGVAEDVRGDGLQQPPIEAAYFPLAAPAAAGAPKFPDNHARSLQFVVRSRGDLTVLGTAVRRVMAELDPQVPVAEVRPMELIVARSVAQLSFTMLLLGLSAAIALTLSAIGIYGVVSYVVSQRRSEIGIRMALGARVSAVGGMVMRQALWMTVAGAAIGVAAAAAGTRLLGALLFEVSPTDPWVLALVPAVLLTVAAAASLAPARRAARVDPVEALRGE